MSDTTNAAAIVSARAAYADGDFLTEAEVLNLVARLEAADARNAELEERQRRQALEALRAIEDLLESQAEHDRVIAEKAWDELEGWMTRHEHLSGHHPPNPYRANPEPKEGE